MEMQQIRYFIALCEDHNFTRAAKRCGVSQPSLTLAIKQLEMELGGPLFDRSRTTSRLSRLGRTVQPHLAAVDRAVGAAKQEAAAFLAAGQILPFKPKESAMRKVVYGAAVAAVVLLAVVVTIRSPQPAGASSPTYATDAKDVYAIEATMNVTALPRQNILSEADE
jgi:Bacterial regulatory helix-turn-helix protein, lysR family